MLNRNCHSLLVFILDYGDFGFNISLSFSPFLLHPLLSRPFLSIFSTINFPCFTGLLASKLVNVASALKHSPSKRRITLKGRPPSTSGSSDHKVAAAAVAVLQQQQQQQELPRSSILGVVVEDKRDTTSTTTGHSSRTHSVIRSPPSNVVYITSV